jgi:hypothetical protein
MKRSFRDLDNLTTTHFQCHHTELSNVRSILSCFLAEFPILAQIEKFATINSETDCNEKRR